MNLLTSIGPIQIFVLLIALSAIVYMFKDQIFKPFLKDNSAPKQMNQIQAIKELLDFRSSYEKNSVIYTKLTEVIQALLKNE